MKINYENEEVFKRVIKIRGLFGYPLMNKQLLVGRCVKYNEKHSTNFEIFFDEFTYQDGYKDVTEFNIVNITNMKKKKNRAIALQLTLF